MNDFFLYVDPTDYSRDVEGMLSAANDSWQAKDTGDYPMYGIRNAHTVCEVEARGLAPVPTEGDGVTPHLFVREEQCGGGLPPLYKIARYH